jgi:hypothetical protein
LAEARTAEFLIEEQRPQALVLDLLLELADVSPHCIVWPADGVGKDAMERLHLLVAELLDPVQLLLKFRFGREIPCHDLNPGTVVTDSYDPTICLVPAGVKRLGRTALLLQ